MDITKVTLNLPTELVEKLKDKAASRKISTTEVIRRGLEADLFITGVEDEGGKVLLEKKDKQLVQLVRK